MANNYYRNKVNAFYEKLKKENGMYKIPSKEEFKQIRNERGGVLALPIERDYVLSGRIDEVVEFFTNIKATKGYFRNKVLFSISGYDDDRRELFEIEEVTKWTRKVIEAVPHIFYYVHEDSWAFMICSLSERLTVVKPKGFENIDMEEIVRRQMMNEEVPQYASTSEVTIETKNHVLSGMKRLGYEIGDVKHILPMLVYLDDKMPIYKGK